MDNLVSILKAYGSAAPDEVVKENILELVQSWASATQGKGELSYLGEAYRSLQREGFNFPPRMEIAGTMVDSSAVSKDVPHLENETEYVPSLPNGLTRTYACAAARPSASQTGNIIAGIAEMSLMLSVQARQHLYLTLVSYSP